MALQNSGIKHTRVFVFALALMDMKDTKAELITQLKRLSLEEVAGVIQNLEEKCANATLTKHEVLPEGNNYALFVWQPNLPPRRDLLSMFGAGESPEHVAEDLFNGKKDYGKTLVFIKMSKDVKELAALIRREPVHQFVLMKGSMMNVSSMTHVFVDGKNLNTLESEWA